MSSLENLLKSTLKFVKAQLRKERGSIQFLQIVVPEKGTLFNISSPFSFCSSLWSLSNLLPRYRNTFTSTNRCLLGTWISRSLQYQLNLRGYMNEYRSKINDAHLFKRNWLIEKTDRDYKYKSNSCNQSWLYFFHPIHFAPVEIQW